MFRIFLTGLRGAGKSSVARALSIVLQIPVIDGDQITNDILKQQGYNSIGEVTSPNGLGSDGWLIMRRAEAQGIEQICRHDYNLIFAPGGGALVHNQVPGLREKNANLLKSWGVGFYLVPDQYDFEYSIHELAARVTKDNEAARQSGNMSNYRHPMFVKEEDYSTALEAQIADMGHAWELRHGLYQKNTTFTIDTRYLSIDQVADKILETYNRAPADTISP